jgi:hypothetical protein
MPVTYTNRKGKTYILCKGTTKTGKPRYYFSPDPKGEIMDHIPEGYEIRESVNGQVSLARTRPALITKAERAAVERAIAKHPEARNYRLDVKQKHIIVYENIGPDMEDLFEIFQEIIPISRSRAEELRGQQEQFSEFSPVLRFILADPQQRTFRVERMTYSGMGGWRRLYSYSGDIKELAPKLIPRLGTDRFFELT